MIVLHLLLLAIAASLWVGYIMGGGAGFLVFAILSTLCLFRSLAPAVEKPAESEKPAEKTAEQIYRERFDNAINALRSEQDALLERRAEAEKKALEQYVKSRGGVLSSADERYFRNRGFVLKWGKANVNEEPLTEEERQWLRNG